MLSNHSPDTQNITQPQRNGRRLRHTQTEITMKVPKINNKCGNGGCQRQYRVKGPPCEGGNEHQQEPTKSIPSANDTTNEK